jgi:peptide/nickel transport system substrate-binding protein
MENNGGNLTRRQMLKAVGAAGGALTLGKLNTWRTIQVLIKPESAIAGAKKRNTLVLGWEGDVAGTFDPPKTLGGHENRITALYADTLWTLFGNSTEIRPALAQKWSVRQDGRTWDVSLKSSLRFQDGTRVNADAVKWNFDRWLDKNHPFHDPPYGVLTYYFGGMEVEKTGPLTLRFRLPKVYALFENNMMVSPAAIVSPTAVKKLGKTAFGARPVCTGAWRVAGREKGVRIVLNRNQWYWGPKPKLDQLIIKPIFENAQRLLQLQAGAVDLVVAMSPEFIPTIQADPKLQLLEADGMHIWWVVINMHEEPMKKKEVRQALNYAVNKEAIIKSILNGAAVLTPGPILPSSWANDPTMKPYPYDPRRAKELLAAAGYSNGFRTRFWVPESGSGMLAPKEIAQVIQANLRDVGVAVEIVTQDWTSYNRDWGTSGMDKDKKPYYGLAEMSWNFATPDPGIYSDPCLRTDAIVPKEWNAGFYSNPIVDDFLKKASGTLDRTARANYYRQFQKATLDDCPWIFMFSAKVLAAASRNVRGVTVNPNPLIMRFENAEFVG